MDKISSVCGIQHDTGLLDVEVGRAGNLLRIVEGNTRSSIAQNKPLIHPPTRSPLLARMATFLPTIKAANADLELVAASADAFTVEKQTECSENGDSLVRVQGSSEDASDDENSFQCASQQACLGEQGPIIEMDLTCGVLDLHNGDACRAAEATMIDGRSIEDALGEAVNKAALEQSPKLFVNGLPANVPPGDVHCGTATGLSSPDFGGAVDDSNCPDVGQAAAETANSVATTCMNRNEEREADDRTSVWHGFSLCSADKRTKIQVLKSCDI